jgi:hypothetical protein
MINLNYVNEIIIIIIIIIVVITINYVPQCCVDKDIKWMLVKLRIYPLLVKLRVLTLIGIARSI